VAPHAFNDPYTAIVQANQVTDVRLTVIDGQIVYDRGTWPTMNIEQLTGNAMREGAALLGRAKKERAA
jgi:hypothetical protein